MIEIMLPRANHYPAQLSGGQRQRTGIARGLATRPSVLLADEATSGLDPETTGSILRLLTELRDDLGVTIVVITHEMDVVRSVADVVAHLDHGRIVEYGRVEEVVRRSDSALSTALLPDQQSPGNAAGDVVWRLRYQDAAVDSSWLSRISRALDTDIALLSGLVEMVGGDHAGRLTVRIGGRLAADKVVAAFAAYGIHARVAPGADDADDADEADEADELAGMAGMAYGDGPRVLPEVDAVIAYNMQFIGAGTSQKYKIYAPPAPRAFARVSSSSAPPTCTTRRS